MPLPRFHGDRAAAKNAVVNQSLTWPRHRGAAQVGIFMESSQSVPRKRRTNGHPARAANGAGPADLDLHELLDALQAMQAGNFKVRLPGSKTGVAGKVCDAFNTIVSANQRIAAQLEHVGEVVAELEQRVLERTAALRRFNEELEQRIEERTRERELALAQLFEAQKMDTIGRLTGGVAHDFNNLLMAVLGSLTLLEKRLPEDPQCRRLLQNAVQGAQRGAALTQRLLAFSRRQELRPESVDLAALVNGMEELLKRALGLGIELECQFPDTLPPVLADANQLELALLNIALNARDAMPNGGRLTIGAASETLSGDGTDNSLRPGDYLRISIADTGIGMDEATLAKATDPFFTTKGPGKGTGLGLSMVHGLAAQSGGLLRIESAPNRGTDVKLWLPRASTAAASAIRNSELAKPPVAVQPCKVLVVDDDLLVLTGTAALIEDLGHTAFEAQSAAEALVKLASGLAIDIVITDHAMPNMTGLQLAQFIQEKHPGLPIILATGYADLPCDPVLPRLVKLAKPCSQHDLAAAIHAALSFGPSSPASCARRIMQ
jgi:signal transduction histidine kinase/ActR/RegA family two-component response regulator